MMLRLTPLYHPAHEVILCTQSRPSRKPQQALTVQRTIPKTETTTRKVDIMSANTMSPSTTTTDIDTDLDTKFRSIVGTNEHLDEGEAGDHDRFAHYVRKEDIAISNETGLPVRAICGKKWVPVRSPEKYAVCPDCKAIHDSMKDA